MSKGYYILFIILFSILFLSILFTEINKQKVFMEEYHTTLENLKDTKEILVCNYTDSNNKCEENEKRISDPKVISELVDIIENTYFWKDDSITPVGMGNYLLYFLDEDQNTIGKYSFGCNLVYIGSDDNRYLDGYDCEQMLELLDVDSSFLES